MIPPAAIRWARGGDALRKAIAKMNLKDTVSYVLDRGIRKLAVISMVPKGKLQRLLLQDFSQTQVVVPSHPPWGVCHACALCNNAAQHNYRPRV